MFVEGSKRKKTKSYKIELFINLNTNMLYQVVKRKRHKVATPTSKEQSKPRHKKKNVALEIRVQFERVH